MRYFSRTPITQLGAAERLREAPVLWMASGVRFAGTSRHESTPCVRERPRAELAWGVSAAPSRMPAEVAHRCAAGKPITLPAQHHRTIRSEEHTSELQSPYVIS